MVQSILRQAGEKVQSILRQAREKVQSITEASWRDGPVNTEASWREGPVNTEASWREGQSGLERTEANRERWRNQTALDLAYSTNIHSLITAPLACVCTYMVNSVTVMNIVRSGVTL